MRGQIQGGLTGRPGAKKNREKLGRFEKGEVRTVAGETLRTGHPVELELALPILAHLEIPATVYITVNPSAPNIFEVRAAAG